MKAIFDFIITQYLSNPPILIGTLVAFGYILRKESPVKVISGTITAMVGITMLTFGGSQMTSFFRPITVAVNEAYGIQGYIMDPYAMRATTQEALGSNFGLVSYVFLVAFSTNLLMTVLGKYTKTHGIFLTGHTGIAHSQAVLWLVIFYFNQDAIVSVLISGILLGIVWSYSMQLCYSTVNKVTNGAGFTIAHNQMLGIWFFGKIARFFGDPETEDAEKLKLPGWFNIFSNNVVSVAIIMAIFIGGFAATLGPERLAKLAGKAHWSLYLINTGITFSMYMVIILTGVRMFVTELSGSFKGIQEKFIPDATPGVDVAAILAFSPNAATLGFIFCTIGTILGMFILFLSKSPYMVLPGFVPLFFGGGPIGVVANKMGGYKACMISSLLLGLIHVGGTVWMIPLMGAPDGIGWVGVSDWTTLWPAITEVFKVIASILKTGPFQ